MNELLQKHGCSNVFTVPEGLKELMSDITREVLRWQPPKMLEFIANYLSALLITRENGIMAVRILDDLCDCRPTVSEHLLQIGLDRAEAQELSILIKSEVEGHEPVEGKEKLKETAILKKVLQKYPFDEEMSAKVCQVVRNAYREFWYRKNTLKKGLKIRSEEPWELAVQNTIELYKKTMPSISELHRATEKIQAAYRGYHVRRNVLRHLQPAEKKKKRQGRKVEMPGPPLDIAGSREIDLGPVVNIRVTEDNVGRMFATEAVVQLGLNYDPMKTVTHKSDDEYLKNKEEQAAKALISSYSEPSKTPKYSATFVKAAPIPADVMSLMSDAKTRTYQTATDDDIDEVLRVDYMQRVDDLQLFDDVDHLDDVEQVADVEHVDEVPLADNIQRVENIHQRISFKEDPPEIISIPMDDDEPFEEVPEIPGIDSKALDTIVQPPMSFEIPEELSVSGDELNTGSCHTTDIEDAVDEENEKGIMEHPIEKDE